MDWIRGGLQVESFKSVFHFMLNYVSLLSLENIWFYFYFLDLDLVFRTLCSYWAGSVLELFFFYILELFFFYI